MGILKTIRRFIEVIQKDYKIVDDGKSLIHVLNGHFDFINAELKIEKDKFYLSYQNGKVEITSKKYRRFKQFIDSGKSIFIYKYTILKYFNI